MAKMDQSKLRRWREKKRNCNMQILVKWSNRPPSVGTVLNIQCYLTIADTKTPREDAGSVTLVGK